MPFFQGAYNFEINGGNMYDFTSTGRGHQTPMQQSPMQQSPMHQPTVPATTGTIPARTTPSRKQSINVDDKEIPVEGRKPVPFYADLYLLFLLRLPNLYFSRIERLGGDGRQARQAMLREALREKQEDPVLFGSGSAFLTRLLEYENNVRGRSSDDKVELPLAYLRIGNRWKTFVSSLLQEWRTLNIVSALLVPGILTIFQISGAGNDPVTRYLAFWSLISAIMSLLYGCMFIIQFSQMERTTVGIEWASAALEDKEAWLWTLDVMLSLPAVWLAWSILAFIACIMSFLWRAGPNASNTDVFHVASSTVLGFRVFLSAVLGVGGVYTLLIFSSFRRYGSSMETAIAKSLDDSIPGQIV